VEVEKINLNFLGYPRSIMSFIIEALLTMFTNYKINICIVNLKNTNGKNSRAGKCKGKR